MAYCPKCGDPLDETDGRLRCTSGGMEVSASLAEMIRAGLRAPRASEAVVPPHEASASGGPGTTWFCPRCAEVLPQAGSHLACRSCGYLLTWPQRYALIELHPHADWPRKRRRSALARLFERARAVKWLRRG